MVYLIVIDIQGTICSVTKHTTEACYTKDSRGMKRKFRTGMIQNSLNVSKTATEVFEVIFLAF